MKLNRHSTEHIDAFEVMHLCIFVGVKMKGLILVDGLQRRKQIHHHLQGSHSIAFS